MNQKVNLVILFDLTVLLLLCFKNIFKTAENSNEESTWNNSIIILKNDVPEKEKHFLSVIIFLNILQNSLVIMGGLLLFMCCISFMFAWYGTGTFLKNLEKVSTLGKIS